jgi:kynurenine formamidase
MELSISKDHKTYQIDLTSTVCLAIPYDYRGSQPNFYDASLGKAVPFQQHNFIGEVKNNKGCNVMIINQNIHCTGTHTECAGHILEKDIYINDVLSPGFVHSELISVTPTNWSETEESYHGNVNDNDMVITKKDLEEKLPHSREGLAIRTLPNTKEKLTQKYKASNTAFFTTNAITFLNDLGVKHLVVDLPSIDRTNDNGMLGNHHRYFEVKPPFKKTITEFAFIPDSLDDGSYFMVIEIPAMQLDAAPSRPFLFKFEEI